MHGVLNFLKPPGMTSHDAVSLVRRVLGTKRVGHTGTLDPAAAGVLPICVGQATRLVEYLQSGRKTYIAEITFGIETDTLDATGEVVAQSDASHVNLDNLRATLDQFRGTISQTPPIFSAIKKDGKKLYELARDGIDESEIEIAPRQVEIHRLTVTRAFESSTRTRAMLRIECGSGTYIRSLVRDIGRALGCGATMTFLVRTQNGAFSIDDALTPEQLLSQGAASLISFREALQLCARVCIEDDAAIARLAQGQQTESVAQNQVPLREVQKDSQELKTDVCQNEAEIGSNLASFCHSDGKTFALANAVNVENDATIYKPEKVFFLERGE